MMRWQQLVDAYDWKARLIPTVIILLPSFSTIFYFYPQIMSNPLQLAGSSLLAFALIYLASMFFRDLGVRYARRFWEERGGLSSTRFGQMRDSFPSHDQKKRIQIEVLNRFGINKTTEQLELPYPGESSDLARIDMDSELERKTQRVHRGAHLARLAYLAPHK
jgi:hypothetical protein